MSIPRNGRSVNIAPIIAILVVVLVLGAAIFMWWSKNDSSTTPKAGTQASESAAALTTIPLESSQVEEDLHRTTIPEDGVECASANGVMLVSVGGQPCQEINVFVEKVSEEAQAHPRDPKIYVTENVPDLKGAEERPLILECYRLNPRDWRCVGPNGEDFYAKWL